MSQVDNTRYTSHHEVSKLLPWYINGSLGQDERRMVETHLGVCLNCRKEVTQQRCVMEGIQQSDVGKLATQAAFARLSKRIHEKGQSQATPKKGQRVFGFRKVLRAWLPGAKPKYRTVFALGLVLVFLSPLWAVKTIVFDKMRRTEYHTLANPDQLKSSSNHIRIVFADGVSQQRKDEIVAGINGRIAEGPVSQGVYRIRVGNGGRGVVAIALASLRQSTDVIFAEPAHPFVPPL